MNKVLIGVQARSTSTRFPNKIQALIGNKTVLQHVLGTCFKAAQHLNNFSSKKISVDVAALIPIGDPIRLRLDPEIDVIEGPEDNVLARYAMAFAKNPIDYVCRITADCPLIPQFIISKTIQTAVMNDYDYYSNVDERCRTIPDGWDAEVFSRRAMEYLNESTLEASDLEHVTTYLRKRPLQDIKWGIGFYFLDFSNLKLSVDTEQDLERIREFYECIQTKYDRAVDIFGRHHVHRF